MKFEFSDKYAIIVAKINRGNFLKEEGKMAEDKRIKVEKKNETRTKDISKMIGEGGIGAEKYYDVEKDPSTEQKKDE